MRFTSPALRQAFRVALALTLTASPAAAQFTAVVAPPKAKSAATSDAAQATPGARTDSAGRTALGDMRAWVDSAAGVVAPDSATQPAASRDSAAAWTSSAGDVTTPPQTPAATNVADNADGMRAPDTATSLPAIAIAGLVLLAAGAWLLRRDRAEQA